MKAVAAIIIVLALAGCATTERIRTVVQEVKIPVPCDPPVPSRPASAVDELSLDALIDEQMRALRADRQRYKSYTGQLEKALTTCRQL